MDLASQQQYIQRATNAKLFLANTNATVLYTAPTGGDFDVAIVESIVTNNNHSGQTNITLTITDTSSNVFYLYNEFVVAADTTHELLSKNLILEAGEILKVTAADANKISIVASIIEYGKGD
tara:strand:- start:4609 stop:4974 length:366 start_codon:yes stop_codon:yes gene_type:complete